MPVTSRQRPSSASFNTPKPARGARAATAPASKKRTAGEVGARTKRRQDQSREEILDAAQAVLALKGLAAFTMEDVAMEVGLTKAALYYYFPSKDALLHALHHRAFARMSQRLHSAVEPTQTGSAALRALIRETIEQYAPHMNEFRLAYLQPQLSSDLLHVGPEQLARLRPLNDLAYDGAAQRLQADPPGRAGVPPRLLVFVAHLAALGVLTMKGLVEAFDDPLLYSDGELIEALARVFEAASEVSA